MLGNLGLGFNLYLKGMIIHAQGYFTRIGLYFLLLALEAWVGFWLGLLYPAAEVF